MLILSITPDDVKECDVVKDLVSIVPSVQGSLSGVVVHHADVGVLVVEGDVSVLVRGGVGVVGKVDLGPGQVGVSNVQGAADHEGLPGAALRKPCVPASEDFQRARVQTTHLEMRRESCSQMARARQTFCAAVKSPHSRGELNIHTSCFYNPKRFVEFSAII